MPNAAAEKQVAQAAIRIVVRPYASPMPLGCFAFGIGNVLLSAFAFHWIPVSETRLLAVMLLAFVAPLELIPCFMGFLSRDTGAATAMGIFAAAWVVQGIQLLGGAPANSPALGIFLLLLALCLAMLAAVTFSGKPLLGILLCVALLRSIAAALVQFGIAGPMSTIAGWMGLLLAAFAFYSGFGLLAEDILQRPLPITFRRGEAKKAMEGDLQQQLTRISSEAGVRQQL